MANPSRAPKGSALVSASQHRWEEITARGWAFVQRQRKFGYAELQIELSISDEAARKLVRRFQGDGRVRLIGGGNGNRRKQFELAPEHRPTDRPTARNIQFWQSMRGLRSFTATDLVAHCTPEVEATVELAGEYCQALLRAGYLLVLRTAVPGRREAIYKLSRNTGPHPPRERRVRAVWDDNLGEYAYVAGAGRIGGAT